VNFIILPYKTPRIMRMEKTEEEARRSESRKKFI